LEKKFYGWTLLVVMFAIYFISAIVTYGGSIAATHMASISDMSRTWFGAGYTVNFIAAGFGGTVAAIVARFIGERNVMIMGMSITAVGCVFMQLAGDNRFVFVAMFGVVVGGGATFATVVPIQTMITRWFVKRRALATGLVLTSGGLGGSLGSILANQIIEGSGGNWQRVWMWWAVFSVVAALIAWRWVKNTPQDVGQMPDGEAALDESEAALGDGPVVRNPNVYQTAYDWPLMEALRHRVIWHIVIIAIFSSAATFMVLTHGVIHLMDTGIDSTTAALSFSLLTFSSIGGRLISGVLGDRFEPRYLLALAVAIKTIGILLILQADSTAGVYAYGLLTGLGFGMSLVAQFTLIGNYFGPTYIQNILAFILPITTIGGAMAPLVGGILHDATGSYHSAFLAAASCAAVATIGILLLRPVEKDPAL
jgi:MFS family permease